LLVGFELNRIGFQFDLVLPFDGFSLRLCFSLCWLFYLKVSHSDNFSYVWMFLSIDLSFVLVLLSDDFHLLWICSLGLDWILVCFGYVSDDFFFRLLVAALCWLQF
jgi:hypothetical protein